MAKRGRKPFSQAKYDAIKEIRGLYNKLKRRIERIEAKYGSQEYENVTLGSAVKQFYDKGLQNFSTKGKTLEQLGNMRLDIEYISSLKTSYMKGAENYQKYVAEWVNLFDNDKDTYDKIFKLYGRLVEENELTEKFKYAVIEEIFTMVETTNLTDEQMHERLRTIIDELYINQNNAESLLRGSGYVTGGKVR